MSEADQPSASDEQITFTVKSANDTKYTVSIAPTATIADLKQKLSSSEYADTPSERQRLIFSGRVLKDGDTVASTKIKEGHTVHLVKSAASNVRQTPAASSSGATPSPAANVPTNIAAGTGNNPLAALTGARYAGFHGLPSASTFGADGGMGGPAMNPDELERLLENPMFVSQMNEAMNSPLFQQMIEQNPAIRDNPMARQMLRDPEYRRMLLDPNMIRQQLRLSRAMGGMGGGSFPAPGVTDNTARNENNQQGDDPTTGGTSDQTAGTSPFGGLPFGLPTQGATGGNPFAALFNPPPATGSNQQAATSSSPPTASATAASAAGAAPTNPFGNLFGNLPPPDMMRAMMEAMGGNGPPAEGSTPSTNATDPQGLAAMARLMQNPDFVQAARTMGPLMGAGGLGSGGAPGGPGAFNPWAAMMPPEQQAPPDTRPPEERYADQLRQLNDMGFFEFDRNIEALRRSGGSVQGAVEYLLSNP